MRKILVLTLLFCLFLLVGCVRETNPCEYSGRVDQWGDPIFLDKNGKWCDPLIDEMKIIDDYDIGK